MLKAEYCRAQKILEKSKELDALLEFRLRETLSEMIMLWNCGEIPPDYSATEIRDPAPAISEAGGADREFKG